MIKGKILNVLNATCDDILLEVLSNSIPNINVIEDVRYQQMLYDVLNEKSNEIDVILLKEDLPGPYLIGNIIKEIRIKYPFIRIVFFQTSTNSEDVNKLKLFLYSKQIYDIIDYNETFGPEEIIDVLFNPKKYEDVIQEMQGYSYEEEVKIIEEFENQKEKEENKPRNIQNLNYNDNIVYEYCTPTTIAFWSPKGGAGVDTLAINTAILLAKYTDMPICLVDLSETPNMHLYLNLNDRLKNIESVFAQSMNGKINQYTIENYIIDGSNTYLNLPNLHLILGAINKANYFKRIEKEFDRSLIGEHFENLVSILKEKYVVTILILSHDIYHIPTLVGLRQSDQINMILENDVASFYSANKYINGNLGMFNALNIDKNKIKYIINKNYVVDSFFIEKFENLNSIKIDCAIDLLPEEIYEVTKNTNYVDLIKNNKIYRSNFIKLVNTITYMEEKEPVTEEKKKNKSILSSLFKNNKKN